MTFDDWLEPQLARLHEVYSDVQWPGIHTLLQAAFEAGVKVGSEETAEFIMGGGPV